VQGQTEPQPIGDLFALAETVLRVRWGYTTFRKGQEASVRSILEGRDTLSLLPTGGGKSVCFQVPALVLGGVTIVVSPLISLMHDQVASLSGRGIDAFSFTGRIDRSIERHLQLRMNASKAFLLYVAPERIGSQKLDRVLAGVKVSLIVVDEAHCISAWGHDFRPAYRLIVRLRDRFAVPVCALTATATPRVQRDIVRNLKLHNPVVIQTSFDRPNISFSIVRVVDARNRVLALLGQESPKAAVIVYDSSREGVEIWAEKIRRAGISATAYHGGLSAEQRAHSQRRWMRKKVRVMVATNAFGMGIDRPDVRHVIHVGLPDSVESYYQEAGRAGRDGRPARATIIDSAEAREGRISLTMTGRRRQRRRNVRLLRPLLRYLDRPMCRRWGLLGYFGEMLDTDDKPANRAARGTCGNCDICLDQRS